MALVCLRFCLLLSRYDLQEPKPDEAATEVEPEVPGEPEVGKADVQAKLEETPEEQLEGLEPEKVRTETEKLLCFLEPISAKYVCPGTDGRA